MKKRGYITVKNYFYMLAKVTRVCPCFVFVSILLSFLSNISPLANIILLQYIMNKIVFGVSLEKIVNILILFLMFTTVLSCITTFFSTKILNPKKQLLLLELKSEIFEVSESVPLETFDDPEYHDSLIIALQVAEGQAVGVVENFSNMISSVLSSGILISVC